MRPLDSRLLRDRLVASEIVAAFVALALALTVFAAGRDDPPPPSGRASSMTIEVTAIGASSSAPSRTEADIDGDGENEHVWIGLGPGGLWIIDGPVTYQARERWRVRAATFGDTDRDGFREIVTLLDSDSGTHVGLFAWRIDRYRERLVTSPIRPRPTNLRIRYDPASSGDVIELTEPDGSIVTYRWNGFGFTDIGRTEAGR